MEPGTEPASIGLLNRKSFFTTHQIEFRKKMGVIVPKQIGY
jgi:hypothetical protein